MDHKYVELRSKRAELRPSEELQDVVEPFTHTHNFDPSTHVVTYSHWYPVIPNKWTLLMQLS